MGRTSSGFSLLKLTQSCLFFQAEAARNVASQNVPSNFKDLIQKLVSFVSKLTVLFGIQLVWERNWSGDRSSAVW